MITEGRLLEALRMKWQDAKLSKLEYYIANINPPILAPIKEKNTKMNTIASHYPHEPWLLENLNTSSN